ncbi:glutathione S-transferase kappa 1-like [Clavelina lepadiformis]|uniref:glutathione S-transferase kappa 1-like n=1 Tax=Clavelina lepadiformis TaxID=159417 RepID=UPI0040429635
MVREKVTVDLFYDILSPYSWVGFEALTRYRQKYDFIDLRLRPVFLGGIMSGTGNKPPGMVPAKAKYMRHDLERLCKYFDLPFNRPKNEFEVLFKKGSLSAQRLLTLVASKYPLKLEDLSRQLSIRVWSKDLDVTTIDSLTSACKDAGFSESEINSLINDFNSENVKKALQETTALAMQFNAFGVPTYVAHLPDGPQVFFGTDRLFMLAHFLKVPFPGALNNFKSSKL